MHRLSIALFAAVSTVAFTQLASAADLPRKAPAVVQPLAPVYNWTGWYVGGNLGWIGSSESVVLTGTDTGAGGIGRPLGLPPGALSVGGNRGGILGGLQIGYNWQSANWVLGLESDFAAASFKKSNSFGNTVVGFVPVSYGVDTRLDYLGTVRLRAGYLFTPTFLTYATGGFAYTKHKISVSAVCPTCGPPANLLSENNRWDAGWTIGGGFEWMFAPQWSLKAEYLYVDFDSISTTIGYAYGANTSSVTGSVKERDHVARLGINYHF
jgi:outer membrane immunogenic protein